MTAIRERFSDWLARHPASPLGYLAALRHGVPRSSDRAEVALAPPADLTVLIGPANHAGQAHLWARALEAADAHIGARSLAVESTFDFPADATVARRVFHNSPTWQRRQRDAARGFSHLLIESLIPPFGRLAHRDLQSQLALLPADVRVALVCHGTDVRAPTKPAESLSAAERQAARIATRHRFLLRKLELPTFVTTPDLLDDVPEAAWLPVVVDTAHWRRESRPSSGSLRVVHAPSSSAVKGTALIDPIATALHRDGVIDYQRLEGVPHDSMPAALADADVVLDQFLLGSYGVAACEAMAAGLVVVGHVSPRVRERVRSSTGRALPIVEATPATLESVLRHLADAPDERARLGTLGRAFVREIHDGRRSADILRRIWIDPELPTEGHRP